AGKHVEHAVCNDGPGAVERRAAPFDAVDGLVLTVRVEGPNHLAGIGRVRTQAAIGGTREDGPRDRRDGRRLRRAASRARRRAEQRLRRRIPESLAGANIDRVQAAGLLVEVAADGDIHPIAFDGAAPYAPDRSAGPGAVAPQRLAVVVRIEPVDHAGLLR